VTAAAATTPPNRPAGPLLRVRNLGVRFATPDGPVEAVRDLSFEIQHGQTLGIVGESGSGKSQSVLALLGLLADNGTASGSAVFDGVELIGQRPAELRKIRGRRIAMVFQDPMTALNPYLTIGRQMSLVLRSHGEAGDRMALARCREMLEAVQVTDPARRLGMYPHELSGGMRQRVMIATALLCRPDLLIADEPTTALDVTVQAQILVLMKDLQTQFGTSTILITHDLGIVAGLCDEVLVMRDGSLRERAAATALFEKPRDPYTRELLDAVPRLDGPLIEARPAEALSGGPVLAAESVRVDFPVAAGRWFSAAQKLRAVDDVSLEIGAGETLGVVGESGCGKSTLARSVLRLVGPNAGRIVILGTRIDELGPAEMRAHRRHMQMIFQDPLASLNPRMTVRDIVAEPLMTFCPELGREDLTARVLAILRRVGLAAQHLYRYPHEFSGGQCQRIGIARALVCEPRLIVCDEPVSALDVTVQRQVIELLIELQQQLGLALMFIAHDLAVVRRLSHRVLVMYLGRAVEVAAAAELYRRPRHPYTTALIGAVPVPDPRVERARGRPLLSGDVPSPLAPPSGCAFRTRCAYATSRCAAEEPLLRNVGGSRVACHHAEQIRPRP